MKYLEGELFDPDGRGHGNARLLALAYPICTLLFRGGGRLGAGHASGRTRLDSNIPANGVCSPLVGGTSGGTRARKRSNLTRSVAFQVRCAAVDVDARLVHRC